MGLDDRKRQAINALSRGANDSAVARAIGVNRATIGRWKKEPEFQEALAAAVGETSEEAIEGLGMLVPDALKLLEAYFAGTIDIPASKASVALNTVRAAASIDKSEGATTSAFEERLRELDTRGPG